MLALVGVVLVGCAGSASAGLERLPTSAPSDSTEKGAGRAQPVLEQELVSNDKPELAASPIRSKSASGEGALSQNPSVATEQPSALVEEAVGQAVAGSQLPSLPNPGHADAADEALVEPSDITELEKPQETQLDEPVSDVVTPAMQESSPEPALPRALDFTLTSARGQQVNLEEYRGQEKLVLVFFRGFW